MASEEQRNPGKYSIRFSWRTSPSAAMTTKMPPEEQRNLGKYGIRCGWRTSPSAAMTTKMAPEEQSKGGSTGGAARGTKDGSEKKWRKLRRRGWGHSFPENDAKIFSSSGTRSAQGPHKVNIGQVVPEAMVDFDSVLRNAILYHEIRFCMTRYGSVLRDTIL